jgi:hypothetical protein
MLLLYILTHPTVLLFVKEKEYEKAGINPL